MHPESIVPSARPGSGAAPAPGNEAAKLEKEAADQQEKTDRMERYKSAEFTRQLLNHLAEAKKAALLALQEQREK
jgi:hypothetical protein